MKKQTPLAGLNPADLLRQGAEEDTIADDATSAFALPPIDQIASAFPHFEILELIGQGGMGAVYKVRQKDLDRIVALKILPPTIGQSSEFSERFTREARALAKLNHPGIVTIHEFGQRDGLHFILMEFVDGANLAQLMRTSRISPREALAIVPQVCDALQYAHDQGLVHRDIKPENLLIDRQGRVKVADFGIAKVIATVCDLSTSETTTGSANQTIAGKIMGTPQYMAPEQMDHPSEVDHRADIYALGVVFYQMLTGELPNKDLQAPSKKVHIDVRLDEIVLRAMEKEPQMRYQTAHHFRTVVDDYKLPVPAQPPLLNQAPPKRGMFRRWWWMFLVMFPLGLLIGLILGAGWVYLIPKKYVAQTIIQVRASDGTGMSPTFFPTQFEVIKSRKSLTAVAEQLELTNRWMMSEEEVIATLRSIITAQNIRGTDLIKIEVRHTNKQDAAAVANAVTLSYQQQDLQGKVIIHEIAAEPTVPVSPNVRMIVFFGGFLGLVLSPIFTLILIVVLQRIFPDSGKPYPGGKPRRTGRAIAIGFGLFLLIVFLSGGLVLLIRLISLDYSQQAQVRIPAPQKQMPASGEPIQVPHEKKLSEYDWADLAAEGRLGAGVPEKQNGRTVLKIENPNNEPMHVRLFTIEKPNIESMRYALSGEVRYENIFGKAYLEMWSDFSEQRFFTRTLGDPSGPMSHLSGSSAWRKFTLPFDRTGTKGAPTRLEVNLFLPRGVLFIGPLKLTEDESERIESR